MAAPAAPIVADESGVPVGTMPRDEGDEGYSSSSSFSSSSSSDCAPARTGSGKGKRKMVFSSARGGKRARTITAKKQEIARDASLVAPLPVVAFVEMRFTPKACGHCSHCRAPPCGTCKTCVLNVKLPPEKQKDRRRCENLTCVRILAKQQQLSQPSSSAEAASPVQDLEAVSAELSGVSSQLATISAQRGSHGFDEDLYRSLIKRKKQLHMAKVKAKAKKSKRKTPFPTGAHEAWGVVSCLEKIRQKFAKFAVKNSASEGCRRTVAIKRQMRDELDNIILQWCTRFSDVVAPQHEEEEFLTLLDTPREAAEDNQ